MQIEIIPSRSDLGLNPNPQGRAVGTSRADMLLQKGLAGRLGATVANWLDAPPYEFDPQEGAKIRKGQSIRSPSLDLARQVDQSVRAGRFPLVLGED